MKILLRFLICLVAGLLLGFSGLSPSYIYTWSARYEAPENISSRVPVPDGYERIETIPDSYEEWLRHLPLKPGRSPVLLYNGAEKPNQNAHVAVIDIDVGSKNLQQCADAVIRLRAEYLYSNGEYETIHFKFTSGDRATFRQWINGYRPIVAGNNVRWDKSARADSSYVAFKEYLNVIFVYAGSYSLSRELHDVPNISEMKIGDVFIEGGFPGHAVIVVDLAVHKESGRKIFLLAQSYMPAQDIHVLKNLRNTKLSPWYDLEFGDTLHTPEWVFRRTDLKRF